MKIHKLIKCYFGDLASKALPWLKSSPSEYFRGTQTGNFRVTKGGLLPFAFDIVAPTLKYGVNVFMKYPADIPDYFKQTFPESLTYDRKITIEDGGCATATVELRWVIPYYLTDYKLFNLQIGLRSLKKKERFIIRQLLNSLSGFTVIFVHDLKRKRRRKVFRQLKLCHIVALCSVKTLKISPIFLSHLIFLSTHSHFPTYLQHCSKIWARCHQVKMNDWFSCTWITSPKNQIRSKL